MGWSKDAARSANIETDATQYLNLHYDHDWNSDLQKPITKPNL